MKDEFNLDDLLQEPQQSLTSPQWSGIPSMPLTLQINEQCVEMLCEWAATPTLSAPPFVAQNRDLWHHLYTEARNRLAAFPFVLVNVRFKDDTWWLQVREKNSSPSAGGIPPKLSESLSLETLLFARQVAREDQNVAKLIFGMSAPVAVCIAKFSLSQVRAIALANTQALEVHWADDPGFWRELLIAARNGEHATLTALKHHAKRRFCGETA